MTALSVTALSKSFGGLRVTANVNLLVEPGERRLNGWATRPASERAP